MVPVQCRITCSLAIDTRKTVLGDATLELSCESDWYKTGVVEGVNVIILEMDSPEPRYFSKCLLVTSFLREIQ